MVRTLTVACMALGAWSAACAADNAAKPRQPAPQEARMETVAAITPVFGQLFAFSYPTQFRPAHEDTSEGQYLQESVLPGETVDKWTQMLTVSGAKGLAANAKVTPKAFVASIAGGYQKACPASFAVESFGEFKIDGHDAFAAWMGCGTAPAPGATYSESMVVLVIKGASDYYSLQWAERGRASPKPIDFNEAKWVGRLKTLMPVRLCPLVRGEKAPYPSCLNRS